MKQVMSRRMFGKSIFQQTRGVLQVAVLGPDGNLWQESTPFGTVPNPGRQLIASNVQAFQMFSSPTTAPVFYILKADDSLWLGEQQIDFSVAAFDAIDANTVCVLGKDGNLWLEHGPFNAVPAPRVQIDGSVASFYALDANTIYVLGTDGSLWLEFGPFGKVPPSRQLVDGSVAVFVPLSTTACYVLGSNGALWLERGPFGNVPPPRQQVDGNVAAFCPFTDGLCYVLGTDGNLWLEQGPFGHIPPPRQRVDSNVTAFEMVDNGDLYVLGSDGKIWLEHGPFTQVPPRREQVDALGLPGSSTWSGGLGFGSGATNANFNFRLVLSSNGTANFSGTYNDTGSIPIFGSPAQNWVVAAALPAGTKLLTFSATGNTPSAQSTTWNTSSSNQQIALAWPLIAGGTVNYRVSDTSDLGGILDDIEQAAGAVVEVIGIIADFA